MMVGRLVLLVLVVVSGAAALVEPKVTSTVEAVAAGEAADVRRLLKHRMGPTFEPTSFPTYFPTSAPTEPVTPVSYPELPEAFAVGGALQLVTIRFTSYYYQWQKFGKKISYDFNYDAVVVDEDGRVWENLVIGGRTDKPQVRLLYTPDPALGPPEGQAKRVYSIRVVEYTYGLDRTSQPFKVVRSFDPTRAPTYQPTFKNGVTPAPTRPTVDLSVEYADGTRVRFGEAHEDDDSGSGRKLIRGEAVRFVLTLTGTSARTERVSLRLCSGKPDEGRNLCSGDAVVASIATLTSVENTGGRFGVKTTALDYVVPADLAVGDDYYVALFQYHSGTRFTSQTASESSFTGPISVLAFAPSATPSAIPSIFTPSAVPSPLPSYAPTSCGLLFTKLPDFWLVGDTVFLELTTCEYHDPSYYSYSYDYGVMDVLLYASSTSRTNLASYEKVAALATYERMGTSNTLRVVFKPDAAVAGLGWYRLRAVEYSRGLDVYSDSFRIELLEPTPEPTRASVDCVVVQPSFHYDDILVAGQDYFVSVVWGGTYWPFAQLAVNVSVYLCHKHCHVDDAVVAHLVEMTQTGSAPYPASFDPALPPSKDYKFVATVRNEDYVSPKDADAAFHSVCISDSFSVQRFAPSRKPSQAPLPHPTGRPSESPTRVPTAAPTGASIIFLNEPDVWVVNRTYTVRLRINAELTYSYDSGGVMDLLLYAAAPDEGLFVQPSATIAVYADLDDDEVEFDFTVPASLRPGSAYQMRAIEYTRGLDVYSKLFSIVDAAPTASPTFENAPTLSPYFVPADYVGLNLAIDSDPEITNDGTAVLAADAVITLILEAAGGDLYDGPTTASVYICGARRKHSTRCAKYIETVAFALAVDAVIDYTPSKAVAGRSGIFFEVVGVGPSTAASVRFESPAFSVMGQPTFAPSRAPIIEPTYAPTGVPTALPTLAPSSSSLEVTLSDSFGDASSIHWIIGSTQRIRVQLFGYGDANAYVDVYLYAEGDEALTPLAVLANGAEASDAELVLEYVVPPTLVGIPLVARAVDYTHGYDARSAPTLVVEASYAPSSVPTAAPLEAPPVYAPTQVPTVAPTVSTLAVAIATADGDGLLGDWVLANATTLSFSFFYTGSLSRNVDGFVTLRLCAAPAAAADDDDAAANKRNQPFNGPSYLSPYESCDTVLTLLRGAPIRDNALILDDYVLPANLRGPGFYFRADSLADREGGAYLGRWNAYSLAYTSTKFSIEAPNFVPNFNNSNATFRLLNQ